MAVYEIVFSPTGGTEKVSGIFTKAFCKKSDRINLIEREQDFSACVFQEIDTCIVAVPSYGGRVPDVAVSRLRRMKGNKAKAILIVVYGNRAYEDTFAELQDVLEESGFVCVSAVAAIAEHSIMHQFAAGRPDEKDQQELVRMEKTIRSKFSEGVPLFSINLPGNRPYCEYNGVPIKPKAGKSCNQCGICAKECPVGAIPEEHPSETDTSICISCMRCLTVCPQKARGVSKALLAAGSMKLQKSCRHHKEYEVFL